MSASAYEYKTVALPQIVQGKRKRGQTEADQVAMALGETIHAEAVDGWEYLRSDVLAARGRAGMFAKDAAINHYTVLVFRRVMEAAWSADPEEEDVRLVPAPAGGPSQPVPQQQQQPMQTQGQGTTPASRRPLPHPETRAAARAAQQQQQQPAPPAPAPAATPMVGDPTSPLAAGGFLSTGGQFSADAPQQSTARPPLGSAQD